MRVGQDSNKKRRKQGGACYRPMEKREKLQDSSHHTPLWRENYNKKLLCCFILVKTLIRIKFLLLNLFSLFRSIMSSNSNSDSEDERVSSSSVKNSFCIEALLARDRVFPIFRNCTESRSSSISPGCEDSSIIEEYCPTDSMNKPSLMLAAIDRLDYTNSSSSAFQPLMRHNQNIYSNKNISPEHIQQMQFEWLSRTGMLYAGSRLQELTGKPFHSSFIQCSISILSLYNLQCMLHYHNISNIIVDTLDKQNGQ